MQLEALDLGDLDAIARSDCPGTDHGDRERAIADLSPQGLERYTKLSCGLTWG